MTSLKHKALLGMTLIAALVIGPTALIAWQATSSIKDYFGRGYAENLTQLNRQKILSPVSRELVLARRFADSLLLREWLADLSDTRARERFLREAEGFRGDFSSHSWFVISASTGDYYFADTDNPRPETPRYRLDPGDPNDAWFFNLLGRIQDYNINVNPDVELGTTRVWLNVAVREGDTLLGLAGTGLDLTGFIDEFIRSDLPGVEPLLIDREGAIQAHPDESMIAYGSAAGSGDRGRNLHALLETAADRQALESAMEQLAKNPNSIHNIPITRSGRPVLMSIGYMPELNWYLVNLVDLNLAQVMQGYRLDYLLAVAGAVLLILLAAIGYMVHRLMIRPLRMLQGSASRVAAGDYDVRLPPASSDEIGDLVRAFSAMADRIRDYTEGLESKVRERTRELEERNAQVAAINRLMSDSIEYASLIQKAILPDAGLDEWFGDRYTRLWKPRDRVGGDYYLFHADGQKACLFGVVDCAGHGVAGALMTMLSRAAFDRAIQEVGITSPAALLEKTDLILRSMLQHVDMPRGLATNMDAGLVYWCPETQQLRYAGAKMTLYCHGQADVFILPGDKRPLLGRKAGAYEDRELSISTTLDVYLTTDGYLDQAGGDLGFGMGHSGFIDSLSSLAGSPMPGQADQLWEQLAHYRGNRDQRDDVCVLGVRLGPGRPGQ